MAVEFNAFDPDENGIGIKLYRYLTTKFDHFDNVTGHLGGSGGSSEYAFIGPDSGGIVFVASDDGWTVDPETGTVSGTLESIRFGQNTVQSDDGSFSQSLELSVSGLHISGSTLQQLFEEASHGVLSSLPTAVVSEPQIFEGSGAKDQFNGGSADDILHGGDGLDWLGGGSGNDRIVGGSGDDKIDGGDGNDVLYGNSGSDHLFGLQGADILKGGVDKDYLYGGSGDDRLYGDDGNDFLAGARGKDLIVGGAGDDMLAGYTGLDTFFFGKNAGNDMIVDFKPGKYVGDIIHFADVGLNSFADVLDHTEKVQGGVMITYDGGTLFLEYVKLSQLDKGDFLFS